MELLAGLAFVVVLALFLHWLSKFKKRARKAKDHPGSARDKSSLVFAASRDSSNCESASDSGSCGNGDSSD